MQIALGNVTPNSTTVAQKATVNMTGTQATYLPCEALQFQALATNTNSVYICQKANPSLTADVHVEIPAPGSNPATRPAWTVGNPVGPNNLNAADYFVLPVVSGEGVRITALQT